MASSGDKELVMKDLAVKQAQRKQAKRATFESLKSKRRQEKEFTLTLNEDADPVSFLFRSIGAIEYDKLVTKCPPSADQTANGFSFDQNKFAPLLLSRVCVEPVMDASEWAEIWNSPEWNRGEVSVLFWEAVNLCSKGLDINPIEAG